MWGEVSWELYVKAYFFLLICIDILQITPNYFRREEPVVIYLQRCAENIRCSQRDFLFSVTEDGWVLKPHIYVRTESQVAKYHDLKVRLLQ